MSTRFRICLAVWIAVVCLAACTNQLHAQVTELTPIPQPEVIPAPATGQSPSNISSSNWEIEIIPARKIRSNTEDRKLIEGCEDCKNVDAGDYARIYKSIPFDRAQYNANPNYRHDSAMEILTGNARHQTIVRHTSVSGISTSSVRGRGVAINPNQYGYLRPSLRLNYYRYFPSLNPYANVWNLTGAF